MQPEQFRGRNVREAMVKVRLALGEDAMILSTRSGREGPHRWAEITAAPGDDVDSYRRRLEGAERRADKKRDLDRIGPLVVAVVGPAGAGKSLTAVKLALSHHAFGKGKVGFITLDTYRVGAVEELQTYAEIAGIAQEVVYNRREVGAAYQRLRECDAVIVDTPGRAPGERSQGSTWEDLLREIQPQEVHLVLPAGLRVDVAAHLARSFESLGVTHVLPTKLDEVPADQGLAELVEAVELPARWVADGHEVPGDLRPAGARILSALGRDRTAMPRDGAELEAMLDRARAAG